MPLTGSQKIVLALFFIAFGVMIYGVIPWSDLGIDIPTLFWWFPEMTASFLFFAILIGAIGRLGEKGFTDTFVDGARDLLGVALIIGIARGITVIMNNGLITDTVLNAAEQAVANLGGAAFVTIMYFLFLPLSFLIPSSSGLATVAMPIMAPLASFADVPAYLVVTAYQTANGLLNLITPTSAVVMGGLAIARVGYGTWLKFVWPLLLMLAAIRSSCSSAGRSSREPAPNVIVIRSHPASRHEEVGEWLHRPPPPAPRARPPPDRRGTRFRPRTPPRSRRSSRAGASRHPRSMRAGRPMA